MTTAQGKGGQLQLSGKAQKICLKQNTFCLKMDCAFLSILFAVFYSEDKCVSKIVSAILHIQQSQLIKRENLWLG